MPKERTAEEVYDGLVTQGLYEEANLDKDEIEKVKRMAIEDYEFGKNLKTIDKPNWRIIFKFEQINVYFICAKVSLCS